MVLEIDKAKGTNGMKIIKSKASKFQLAYTAFCPIHAHGYHTGPCQEWERFLKARRDANKTMSDEMEARRAQRGEKHAAAKRGAASSDNF